MKHIFKLFSVIVAIFLVSCNSEPTLQEYFVNHQDDKDFIAVDIPSSLLDKGKIDLNEEETAALESIKKINFLALRINDNNKNRFEEEKTVIKKILDKDQYETLMKFGSNGVKAVLKFQGEEDDIDEVIVFASDREEGLALVRVLGDNMRPEKILKLAKSVEEGKIDIEAFKDIAKTIDFD
ncbi:DUF4252 domain-containing protein [Aquimarina algicola]|nr:DUF4252 domain-containing protein [Aquimarina algicola]